MLLFQQNVALASTVNEMAEQLKRNCASNVSIGEDFPGAPTDSISAYEQFLENPQW